MICEEIIKILEQQSPVTYAYDWDNVGLLVGSNEKEIRRIYVALDATDEAIEEAVNVGADMLLTHHPMIFKGLKKINSQDFIGRRVIEIIKHDMAYYAMHTNFDIAGMADLAAEQMSLADTAVLQMTGVSGESGTAIGIGKIGKLPKEMSLTECISYVKRVFDVDMVKVFGCPRQTALSAEDALKEQRVCRIAICPGSGKSVINDAIKAGAQVLVTGDIDHHEGIDAAARGMTIIDAGHYGLEKIFIPYMKQFLEESLPGVEVIAQKPKKPFVYI